MGGADAELREELRRVVPRLPLHAYGDVDRLHADLPASCVRNTAIVRAAGGMFLESVMARRISVKRGDLEIAAASWLAVNSPNGEIQVRFDIIDMLVVSADRALLKHHITAFSCGVE